MITLYEWECSFCNSKAIFEKHGRPKGWRIYTLYEVSDEHNANQEFECCAKCAEGIYKTMPPIRKILFTLFGR